MFFPREVRFHRETPVSVFEENLSGIAQQHKIQTVGMLSLNLWYYNCIVRRLRRKNLRRLIEPNEKVVFLRYRILNMFVFIFLSNIKSIHYNTIVESAYPESLFLQKITVTSYSKDRISLNIRLDGDLSYTFLDTEEEKPRKFLHTPHYLKRIHKYSPLLTPRNIILSSVIVVKGFFDRASLDIEIEYPKSLKDYIPVGILIVCLALLMLLCLFIKNSNFGLFWIILLGEQIFLMVPICPNVKAVVISVAPYRFPDAHTMFSLNNIKKARDIILANQNTQTSYNECKTCNFRPVPSVSNSSSRDLILSVGFDKIQNLNIFIRSARTCGCKAQIVIFTNIDTEPLEKEYKGCGVVFIKVNSFRLKYGQKQAIRVQLMPLLLNMFPPGSIDRIAYADLYDTIFQGDPFLTNITDKDFVFSDEEILISDNGFTNVLLGNNMFMGFPYDSVKKETMVCSGAFIGGFGAVKFLINVLSNWYPADLRKARYLDQIYFDVLAVSKILRTLDYNFVFSPNGGFVSSLNVYKNEYIQSFPSYRKKYQGMTPLILHQINRLKDYYSLVDNLCKN